MASPNSKLPTVPSAADNCSATTQVPGGSGPPVLHPFDQGDACPLEEDVVRCRVPPSFEPGMSLKNWKRRVSVYLGDASDKKKARVIWSLLGDKVSEILCASGVDIQASEERIWNELARLFPEPVDPIAAKSEFWARRQRVGESVDEFVTDLRLLAARAFPGLGNLERETIMFEWFVQGIADENVRRALAQEPPQSLDEALARARRCISANQKPAWTPTPVYAMRDMKLCTHPSPMPMTPPSKAQDTKREMCYYCQRFGANAWRCGHNGRRPFARGAPRGSRRAGRYGPNSRIPSSSRWLGKYVGNMWSVTSGWLPLVTISINTLDVNALVDTGAACSIVTTRVAGQDKWQPSRRRISTANGSILMTLGEICLKVRAEKTQRWHNFLVSNEIAWDAILGSDFLRDFGAVIDFNTQNVSWRTGQTPLKISSEKREIWSLNTTPGNLNEQIDHLLLSLSPTVPGGVRSHLRQIIEKFASAFAWTGFPPGRTNVVQHRIDTGTAAPIRQAPRRIPVQYQQEMTQLIDQMLSDGVIQPSNSPWAAPVVLVKKKNGSLRLCVDYRKLNAVTRKDSFPLPRIDSILESLKNAKWFSTIDLASGYWQVEVAPEDQPKTAFCIPTGLYEFKTMPFGLANAPATCQRLMQIVLKDIIPTRCMVYLDDVVIHGRTMEENLDNLREVLDRLVQAGLKVKPAKCKILQKEVTFLGHVVNESGIRSQPEKTQAVQRWPVPQSQAEVSQFLGLASYYRRFVKNFAQIAAPLHRLTEKHRQFQWTPECQKSFNALKVALVNAPVLAFPDVSPEAEPFILDTDASETGIGAVLSQRGADGLEHVIAYASRSLTKCERNYCTTRKEMLALVHFVKYFKHYLLGKHFVVRTDHESLKWLQNFKEPEGQVARWQERLQEFDFECVHRPGKQHRNADALSRQPLRHSKDCPCTPTQINAITLRQADSSDWATIHRENPETRLIYERLQGDGIKPTRAEIAGSSWETHCLWSQWPKLHLVDGVLYLKYDSNFGDRIVVPQSQVEDILHQLHTELGHAGQQKMENAVSSRFWWPQQRRDVINYCNRCVECLRIKPPRVYNRAPLQPITTGYPNEVVGVDIVGPLPETARANRYILVMVDLFTKWCEAVPLNTTDANTVARAIFDNWIARWGAPEQLHSDRGSNFESQITNELCTLLGIRKTRTTAYHPQGNGQVERTNRSLKSLLQAFTTEYDTREWDRALPRCLLAYRATVHTSTAHSPHCMLTGREMRLPLDLSIPFLPSPPFLSTEFAAKLHRDLLHAHQLARHHLESSHRHQKEYYDKSLQGSPVQPGQLVYLHQPAPLPGQPRKLYKPWAGPYVVQEVYSDATCRIIPQGADPNRSLVAHFNRLKLATNSTTSSQLAPSHMNTPPDPVQFVEVPEVGGTATPVTTGVEDNASQVGGTV